ncbi:GNAT family N-acetyltransferase [Streptomyces prasinopilosus]|uniref:Acetyltransferase (GNAT) family protein n=1 Tax=Streptomyces prasinopilosus TaxID=67344 RepID=A0A1G6U5E6_9ACTN|nr:GNAT family N-acetyltransferase [Streptomyces prasinopilosus]SDD36652.1 Acetyltransferase (GNAT) family protein [Streptomyces prasinopilosus]
MTTTLRPAEPLQQNPDGTRSRRYRVCVNSRPVGRIHIGTHPVFGEAVARIMSLRIDEPDRGRGRGTVAALAAEEIVRGWGCRRIEATVPAEAEGAEAGAAGSGAPAGPALRLATALGYVVRNYAMEKALGDVPPALPEGSRGRPMTDAEFGPWSARSEAEYVRDWIERGVPETEARAKAAKDHADLLPDGRASRNMLFSVLEHEDTPVGTLWLALRTEQAYVFDVEVDAAHRGRGHGRSLMLLAEAQAIAAGRRAIGLNVFTGNTPAERLYASLSYGTTRYAMYKHLL